MSRRARRVLRLASAAAPIPVAFALLAEGGCSSSDGGAGEGACTAGEATAGNWTIAAGSGCLRAVTTRVRAHGAWKDGAAQIEIEPAPGGARVRLVTREDGVEALALVVPHVRASTMQQHGYQSWGFSGATTIPDDVPRDADGAPKFAAARTGQPEDEAIGVSYAFAALGDDDDDALLVGATSATIATTGIAARRTAEDEAELTIVYGVAREPLARGDDGSTRSEPIFVARGALATTLPALRDAIATSLPGGARVARRPLGGWFSWNARFDAIDAASVSAAAQKAQAALLPVGMPLVEIDDGWERAWGDWQASDRFPGGLEAAAKDLTSRGLVPGVWLAPFLVDRTVATAQKLDPSLFVRDASGAPIVHTPNGNTRALYVLDGSNPKAMELAAAPIAALSRAGFRFFKLDFLYAGALPGTRSAPVTGTEALRLGLDALRRAAGDDAIVNACGAPILPVVGWADSLRIGADTAFSGVPLSWPFVAFAARELAARAFLAPLVWPDADQAQLRAPYTDAEARASAAVAALAGPAYGLGDDVAALDPARLAMALDPKILDLAGAPLPARADGLLAGPTAAVAINPLFDGFKGRGDTYAAPPAVFHATGKSGAAYTIRFTWLDEHGVTIE